MKELKFHSPVKDGKILPGVSLLIESRIKEFDGQEVTITLKKKTKPRTLNQNAYWFAMLDAFVTPVFRDAGSNWDSETIHEAIVGRLGYTETLVDPQGNTETRRLRTSKFNTQQFNEFLERAYAYLAETFGIILPPPHVKGYL